MSRDLFSVRNDGTISLNVHAQPGAGRSQVSGVYGTALKVRVAAPPADGKANEALTKVLAAAFSVAPSAVALTSGHSSRTKRFAIAGLAPEAFEARLDELIAEANAGPGPRRRDRR